MERNKEHSPSFSFCFFAELVLVPIEVNSYRAINLSLKWIILYSRQRVGRTMAIKLASEIIDTANDIGNTIKKKEETHKMAEANKAFAHFRY